MKSFLSSIGVALAAAFSASLSAAILSFLILDNPLYTLLFITALSCYFAFRLLPRYDKASIIHHNPPLFLLAFGLSVFIVGHFLIVNPRDRIREKIDRYKLIVSLWKDGMHGEAIDRLETFTLLDQLKK